MIKRFRFPFVDLFCGGGGTTTGAVEALIAAGLDPVGTAINHDKWSIQTHKANHPNFRHLETSVDDINPRHLYKRGELKLLWASPECTNHSRAKSGQPMNEQSRATGHCVIRWAEALYPDVILVENVPAFLDWGALGANGKPLKSEKGKLFHAWVAMLRALKYKVDWKIVKCAHYGDPTTRERLFIQAVRGRRNITWPNPTHVPRAELITPQQELFNRKLWPWATTRGFIDWKLKGRWLDEMPGKKQYGGLPLSPKTIRRIWNGFLKYGMRYGDKQYIVAWDNQSGSGVWRADEPLSTVCTKARHGLVMVELRGTAEHQLRSCSHGIDEPVGAVTAGGVHHSLLETVIVPTNYGERPGQSPRCHSVDQPFPTVVGTEAHALAESYLVQVAHGDSGGRRWYSVDEPGTTVCGKPDTAIIEPALLPQQSGGVLRQVSEPSPTVATSGAIALLEIEAVEFFGDEPREFTREKPGKREEILAIISPLIRIGDRTFRIRFRWRMLQTHELQLAQGFHRNYIFCGTKKQKVKQIGNAVPRRTARALVYAAVTGNPDVSVLYDHDGN